MIIRHLSLRRQSTSCNIFFNYSHRQLNLFFTGACLRRNEKTIPNLKIGSHTRVVFQGFTGRQATFDAKQSIEYGTKIVGGVRPGRTGEHLGLPVVPSMRAAKEQLNPDATAVYVAAGQAAGAIEEAVAAEIPLIVAVAEHIPLHDQLRIHQMLRTQSKSRLVGPNCPGMISPIGRCRIGFPPIPCFTKGSVGIVAKSGTLSYETVASTTRAGVGQSLVIGMGGDVLPGTDFVDALTVFEQDEATKGIIIVGELGGSAEEEAADWIADYNQRTKSPKPIMGLVAGFQAAPGRIMGHAGAYTALGEGTAESKYRALEKAGVVMTNHPAKFGNIMKQLLGGQIGANPANFSQIRGMHTASRRLLVPQSSSPKPSKRYLSIAQPEAFNILKSYDIPVREISKHSIRTFQFTIRVTRPTRRLEILASHFPDQDSTNVEVIKAVPYPPNADQHTREGIATEAASLEPELQFNEQLRDILLGLMRLYQEKEASTLKICVWETKEGGWAVHGADFQFDDAAFRSGKRQQDLQPMRDFEHADPQEVEAEKDGIVYIKLAGDGNIGTLVNGAGLAMNTTDAIYDHGGRCANFLDTGGKATSETVKKSFGLILKDLRVTTIFVNIFGGLTLCDMIAEGILLAYKDLGIKLPVVVRLRGTNEQIGQKMIAESGLPLHAFDDFEEAADKVIELARSS